MALSGSFNTNKYSTSSSGSIGLNLSWSATQSMETNSTTISWTLKSNGSMSSGYSVYGGPITVTIGGTTVYNQTSRIRVYGGGSFKKTGTITIQHEDDGTKSISMSVRAALYSASVNCTGSASYELDPIMRCAYVTQVANFTDEDNPVMYYTNPLGDLITSTQACLSLDGTTAAISYRDIAINGTSYTFNLTTSERNTLLAATPNSSTLTVYFLIKSVMDGQTFYSSKTATMSVINGNPTITSAQYYDTNADTIAVTQDATKIVQALSTVEFKFGSLAALKYATLVSVSITINGVTESVSLSGTTASNVTKTIGTLNVSSNLVATVDLVDSRGLHATQEITITICSWSIPTAVISLARINNFYTECNLKVQASYSSIDGQNTVVIKYQTKKTADADYGAETIINDNQLYTIQLDNTYEWNVRIKVTDAIGGTTTYNLTVGKGIPNAFWDRLLRSYSLNCFPTHQNALEVDGNIYATNMIPSDQANARASFGIGTTLIYNQQFSSGTVYLDLGYDRYIFRGRVTSQRSTQTIVIPAIDIPSDIPQAYMISDKDHYFSFNLIYETVDGVIKLKMDYNARSDDGYLDRVYGVN